jgi:hypothetical protein
MRRNRLEPKTTPATLRELVEHPSAEPGPPPQKLSPPRSLHHIFDDSLEQLTPGDILLLDESPTLKSQVALDFFAVLACPRCGILDLVTSSQYFGVTPVICGSNACSCSIRIEDESRIVYLPVN